ncbi:MAG: butyrate kinase [Clostridiales bacterium]|nr:butyrate kinase [Clostridiales bacterium]
MKDKVFKILTINPGSTSTKLALFDNEQLLAEKTVRYDSLAFAGCADLMEQKPLRMVCLTEFLQENGTEMPELDAVVGRGGLIRPVEAGTYTVNEQMLADLYAGVAGVHASSLGGVMAEEIGRQHGIPAYIVDPVVVDELEPVAKISGLPGIRRVSVFHALNTRAVARLCAADLGLRYEDARFIVAHLGGGISVGAHRYGRVIDVNNGLTGEGPFSPERSGGILLNAIIERCYSGEISKQEMLDMVSKNGGMKAYLGTHDLGKAEEMILQGDEKAAIIVNAMAYQVCKEIGAMAAVLEGRIDGIILTGGLAYSPRFTGAIKQRVDQLAPVYTYPGENELQALAAGALRVLRGEEKAKTYEPIISKQ